MPLWSTREITKQGETCRFRRLWAVEIKTTTRPQERMFRNLRRFRGLLDREVSCILVHQGEHREISKV
jgi:hypothetical protein